MNNVKKLLAVLVVVTMLITAMIPVMAADTFSYDAQAKVLWDLKLFLGESATEYVPGLGNDLTREQGVIMLVRLLGAEDDALALTSAQVDAALTFADAADISTWAKAYVAYAKINGYFVGVGDNKADPKGALLGKAYATMVLRAMGYTVDAAAYNTAATLLVEKGGLTAAEAAKFNDKALIRDDAVGITYGALLGKTSANNTLIAALVAAGAVDLAKAQAAGLIPVVADVKDATITNLKELVVTFTAPVNATEAAKTTNYTINGYDPAAVSVAADLKSVVLTAPTSLTNSQFANYSTYTVIVEKLVGIPADVTKSVKAVDITVPTLVSATPTGPKTIKLTFSEPVMTPVDIASLLKLDNGYYAIASVSDAAGVNSITVSTYVDLTEGSHTIALSTSLTAPITDLALYAVQPTTLTFNYVKDVSPLSYTFVSSTEKTVTVKFNKAVTNVENNPTLYATHTYNTPTNKVEYKVENNVVVSNPFDLASDSQTMTITFDKPLPPGTATVFVGYESSPSKIVDGYGNVMEAFSFAVTTTPDLTKPTATVAFTSATEITVTFSEAVNAPTTANFVLKDSAGTIVALDSVDTTSSTVYVLNTVNPMNGGSFTLQISGVTDLSTAVNAIETVVIPFTATDKVAPEIVSVERISSTKVRVNFSEAMDAATITNINSYRIYSYYDVDSDYAVKLSTFDSKATVAASANNKAAIITFSAASLLDTMEGEIDWHIFILAPTMKDVAGNPVDLAYYDDCIPTVDELAVIGAKAVEYTSPTTIKLTLNDVVSGMKASDFVYNENGKVNSIAVSYDASYTYVTLYINSQGTYNTIGEGITVSTTAGSSIVNSYGTKVLLDGEAVTDKCGPKIANVDKQVVDGKIVGIYVEFSEAIYVPSLQESDFTVTGTTISSIAWLSNDSVFIDIADIADNTSTYLTIVGSIEDSNRNATTSGSVVADGSYNPGV